MFFFSCLLFELFSFNLSVCSFYILKGKLNNIVEIPAGGSQPHQPCPHPLRGEEAGEEQQGD